ncbi:MAG TPA: glycosyltransferase [Acidobacteriota bacterium]|jgi:glycosyltransferase involved in cell wall biosynthesis
MSIHTDTRHSGTASSLLVVVAYEAEAHVTELIQRLAAIPAVRDEWSILFLDDASTDGTRELAEKLFEEHGFQSWNVVRHDQNQGYGGNQKVGYRHALQSGNYTHVALLHGDCQYPPEALPSMLETALAKKADVILGSRMWSMASAWRGSMPLYKIAGNKVLTRIQNLFTGRNLSEYHSGLRLYSTELLGRIPFELNSDSFDFDTEILLQAFYVDATVAEVPIPTRYADEVCRVVGFRYAANILRATFQYWLQKHGMGCSLRFRDLLYKRTIYLDKTSVLGSTHQTALRALVQQKPKSVLDIGCGAGHIGAAAKKQIPTLSYSGSDLLAQSPPACDRYWRCDLNRELVPTNPFDYDAVLCLDVLEHLHEPEQFLLRLRQSHSGHSKTRFIFSTANVAFVTIRFGLLLGRFEYGDRGILDIDHSRLMTRASFVRLIRETGFVIERIRSVPVPFQIVFGDSRWTRMATRMWQVLVAIMPGLFSFQTLVEARSKPSVPSVSGRFRNSGADPAAVFSNQRQRLGS